MLTAKCPLSRIDGQVLDVWAPNAMGVLAKSGHYAAKVWGFVSDDPRESNTEGGVFPAIFGTVMMVMIMSLMVTPLGVLAAFYLREYARQGTFVSAVRIAVNNLAGVPSIVFGLFVYIVLIVETGTSYAGYKGSVALSLLMLPVVTRSAEVILLLVPNGLRESALALGAPRWRMMLARKRPTP